MHIFSCIASVIHTQKHIWTSLMQEGTVHSPLFYLQRLFKEIIVLLVAFCC